TGFPRKPGIKLLSFVMGLLKSNRLAKRIVLDFKPQIAIGVGGFASGPLLRTAARYGIPTLIQEQNSYAGITNKLLGKRASKICVAYDNMDRYFPAQKIIYTGNPVRENLLNQIDNKQEAYDYYEIKKPGKVILIVGGSLGARSINQAVLHNIETIAGSDVEVIWQTGSIYYHGITEQLQGRIPANLHIHEFLNRMDLAYAAADIIISRAGAGTISELCLIAKPVILVPSPNVAEDHQTKNARSLSEKEAAIMIPDSNIKEQLIGEAIRLINSPGECEKLSDNIKKLAKPGATKQIVDEVEKLIHK
ncbi:MAG: UDP-N-acetylglucosamine--N-acetylmuramyl-(pentapeptide) pyrophosphoryl-undecaprenol N-acetylglucosamine transferase, partial [Mariniphaga sp.]